MLFQGTAALEGILNLPQFVLIKRIQNVLAELCFNNRGHIIKGIMSEIPLPIKYKILIFSKQQRFLSKLLCVFQAKHRAKLTYT